MKWGNHVGILNSSPNKQIKNKWNEELPIFKTLEFSSMNIRKYQNSNGLARKPRTPKDLKKKTQKGNMQSNKKNTKTQKTH